MDITDCECYSYSYSRPHLSGLRSNYSSEINQFYKSKIQSHVPWLLYPYTVAQCTYSICLCERPNRHLTMVLKNSFVECNLKLHMDKLVHLANMFTIQRDGDNRRIKGSESTTIASGYTHSTTLNKSRIILTLISYISVANVDLNGNKINAYFLFVFLPCSLLIAQLNSSHLGAQIYAMHTTPKCIRKVMAAHAAMIYVVNSPKLAYLWSLMSEVKCVM